jgi:hypothetical protein
MYSGTFEGSPNGDLTLDSAWAMQVGGIANGDVAIYGQTYLDYIKSLNVKTYDPNNPGKYMPMPEEQLDSYLVPVPPPLPPVDPEPVR